MAPPSTRQLDSPTWSHPSRLLPSNRVIQPASWLTAFGAREPAEKPRAVKARARPTVRLNAIPMVFPHFLNFEFDGGAAARKDEIPCHRVAILPESMGVVKRLRPAGRRLRETMARRW